MGQYSRKRSARSGLARPTKRARTTRTTYRRKTTFKRPARFAQSRKRYTMNRAISKQLNKFIETKYAPCAIVNENPPYACYSGSRSFMWAGTMGDLPTAWDQQMVTFGGIQLSQGDGGVGQRNGHSVYLKKTHATLEIDMRPITATQTPPGLVKEAPLVEFRVIVCKARRAVTPAGVIRQPQKTLFLNLQGQPLPYDVSTDPSSGNAIDGTDFMVQPLNKRDWVIRRDTKFTMTSPLDYTNLDVPADPGQVPHALYNGKYPSRKRMVFNLPYYKNTRYVTPVGTEQTFPVDIDYHWAVFVFARPIDKTATAQNWEVNWRGVTSYQDV